MCYTLTVYHEYIFKLQIVVLNLTLGSNDVYCFSAFVVVKNLKKKKMNKNGEKVIEKIINQRFIVLMNSTLYGQFSLVEEHVQKLFYFFNTMLLFVQCTF